MPWITRVNVTFWIQIRTHSVASTREQLHGRSLKTTPHLWSWWLLVIVWEVDYHRLSPPQNQLPSNRRKSLNIPRTKVYMHLPSICKNSVTLASNPLQLRQCLKACILSFLRLLHGSQAGQNLPTFLWCWRSTVIFSALGFCEELTDNAYSWLRTNLNSYRSDWLIPPGSFQELILSSASRFLKFLGRLCYYSKDYVQ